MLSQLRTLQSLKGQDRGFTLIELLIVVLIVGILAAVGVPLYLGYVKDAKSAEGKSHVGAIWTSVQASAIAQCNTATAVTAAYARAGLDSAGATADGRWIISAGAGNTLLVNCTTGAYTTSSPLFTLDGNKSDVNGIKIRLTYVATGTPPAVLECDLGAGSFSSC